MAGVNPFNLSAEADKLAGIYLDPAILKNTYIKTTHSERLGIIRLWLTEGIPFAFKDHPLLYEEIRDFIARGINVDMKEITLVGSARTGYSLSKCEWGRPFNSSSDFDFAIISDLFYKNIVSDFQKWARDFYLKNTLPKNIKEMSTWLYNIKYLDRKIYSGFIQVRLIPYNAKYPTVKKCYDTVWLMKKKLECTAIAPRISDASIRVYSSWKTCMRQLQINFISALNLKNKP